MALARDLALALDPVLLAEAVDLPPDPWQRDLLRSEAQRVLLLCARQTGKSTITSLMALHEAVYRPPALVLLLSPSLRQSSEVFRKVLDAYRALGEPVAAEQESTLRLELENGSRIISLPGAEHTIRGYSGVHLLVVDEAARVEDDLYYAVRPMLAVSGGKLIALSTPWGKRGWFHKEWTEGQGWERVKVTAPECPRIPPEFLAQERASMPDPWYRAEYNCEFTEAEDGVFQYEHVAEALTPEVRPLFPTGGPDA